MIIPSIDLMNGQTVQLVGGKEHALDAGDPIPIAKRFSIAGEIAVIDLDAALGRGSNAGLILPLLRLAKCRIGGGIRDEQTAVKWLDAGASKIVLGTAAKPDLLKRLPRDRVIAALDADNGEVVVEGWRRPTGETILDRMRALEGLVGGFLVTFIEREGRLSGTNLDLVPELVRAAAGARVTIAGGVTTADEIRALDDLGADAQVGMALYTGRLELADAITSVVRSDRPDGLWPTVVTDELGTALGLVYSSNQSVREAIRTGRGVYHSRRRGLWTKGESSGNVQTLLRIDPDCDRDALRFTVRQSGQGFCHLGRETCWGTCTGLALLASVLDNRAASDAPDSYTKKLLRSPSLLASKLVEEAGELAEATGHAEVVHEAADLLFFAMTAMMRSGVSLAEVSAELDRRGLRLTRRPGEAKPVQEKRP
ncbi:MAG: phosphoribosyl-ATP diphosphatase [Phycisphaerales bacterium]|nr:phosphoribosyl-ATP diphosphatase [Phycisphaerales bacterium]